MTRASKAKDEPRRRTPGGSRGAAPAGRSMRLWIGLGVAVVLVLGAVVLANRKPKTEAAPTDAASGRNPVPLAQAPQAADAPRRISVPDSRMINISDDPVRGDPSSPVLIVEFADFECPSCGQFFLNTEGSLNALYGDRIEWAFVDFPLQQHARAIPAAVAAQCAHRQGKFWPYHDLLFRNQGRMSDDDLRKYADQAGLDRKAFDACFDKQETLPTVQQDVDLGNDLGVDATPTFFIGGEVLKGAMPITSFMEIIDPLLQQSGEAASAGQAGGAASADQAGAAAPAGGAAPGEHPAAARGDSSAGTGAGTESAPPAAGGTGN